MTGNAVNHGQCLTDETLTDYLEGGLDPAVKAASEVHLLACDTCRVKLAFFMRLLKEEVAPRETTTIRLIQEEWTRAQNDRRLPNRRTGDRRRWKIASGGVAAALLFAFGTRAVMDHTGEPRSANEVIQLLLAENRPFEARISGQPHRPYITTRGVANNGTTYGLLAGQMTRLAATTYEMGQFHLLQKDFRQAIPYLELAEREAGVTPDVHNDLGVAYMESRIPANLQKASVEFRHALAAKPEYAPAVFNLAILSERMGKRDQAEQQWMQYLQLESDRQWSDEAKSKLEGIKH
jgi:tetratricopeptide (TPR) repeat protein